MLGKVVKGGSFGGLTEYVLEKEGAEILDTNMAGRDHRELAREFEIVARKNERVRYPVAHVSLSPHPEDKLSKADLIDIGRKFLEKAGYENSQWAIAYHNDAIDKDGLPRPHLHLIINRVQPTNDFKTVSSWMDYKNTQKIVREIEREANLTQIKSSWESEKGADSTGQVRKLRSNPQAEASVKSQMQGILDSAIASSESISEVIEKIEDCGVETRVAVKDGAIEGISYKMNEVAIAARKLGNKYTISRMKERKLKLGKLDKWYYPVPHDNRREYDKLAALRLQQEAQRQRSLKTLFSSSEVRDRNITDEILVNTELQNDVADEALINSELLSDVADEMLVNSELLNDVTDEVLVSSEPRDRNITDEILVNTELQNDVTTEVLINSELQSEVTAEALVKSELQSEVTDEVLMSSELQSDVTDEVLVNSELQGDVTTEALVSSEPRDRNITDEVLVNSELQGDVTTEVMVNLELQGDVTDEMLDRPTDSKPNTDLELERQKAQILKRKPRKELDLDM